jgi:hypothetical protein
MLALSSIVLLALSGASQDPALPSKPPVAANDAKQPLSVLYAGAPGTEREKSFVALLKEHFAKVETIALGSLSMKTAAPFDVVVADWRERYAYVDGKAKQLPGFSSSFGLDDGFTRPIVMIGAVGGEIARWSKIGWL